MAISSYNHYDTAAIRHIGACAGLIDSLSQCTSDLSRLSQKAMILKDLYYLSGYIIECSYSFAVFKYISTNGGLAFPDNIPVNLLDNSAYLPIRNSCNLSYRLNTIHRIVRTNPAHTFINNGGIRFFQDKTIHDILCIKGSSVLPTDINLLFNGWNADIRYEIPLTIEPLLTDRNILAFCKVAGKIYLGIKMHIIGEPASLIMSKSLQTLLNGR